MTLLRVEDRQVLFSLVEEELRLRGCFVAIGTRRTFPSVMVMYALGHQQSVSTFEGESVCQFDSVDVDQAHAVMYVLSSIFDPETKEQVEPRLKVLRDLAEAPFL